MKNLLCLISVFSLFCGYLYYVIYYKLDSFVKHSNEITGKLLVFGKNKAQIKCKKHQKEIKVYFVDDEELVPCNIPTNNVLDWYIIYHKKYDVLNIEWEVGSTKTICWEINY